MTADEQAQDLYAWLKAYIDAGFTREEAMQILTTPRPASYPPELIEYLSKWSRFAESEMDE